MANLFLSLVEQRWKFNLFLLRQLPAAYFSGVRVASISNDSCTVTVPFKWFSQNPFRSTYFACLAMAAEMSTGILAMAHTYQSKPGVSMLVTNLHARYFKKATDVTTFVCKDGEAMRAVIETAKQTGEGIRFTATSVGRNLAGEIVAEFDIEWSFKAKLH
jgi:hypothetical protein